MKARDLMRPNVIVVTPDTPVGRIAELLFEHGISAVPVAENGAPLGLISETDLVARSGQSRGSRQSWYLRVLAGRETRGQWSDAVNRTQTARDVMSAPVITVGEDAELADVMTLMVDHNIKRVPVVKSGRIVGIISRADLMRALAQGLAHPSELAPRSQLDELVSRLDKSFQKPANPDTTRAAFPQPQAILSAADFRSSASHFLEDERQKSTKARREATARHAHDVEVALGTHINEDTWRRILIDARVAAEHGAREHLALRIPREACSDGGRAINVGDPDWPTTLRGEAAELWLRFKRDLEPKGFRLHAQILDYSGGMLGDVGLFLTWGG